MDQLMFRPLVFTVCYGNDDYYEALRLMVDSLNFWGEYKGPVLVIADRPEQEVISSYIQPAFRPRLRVVRRDGLSFASRFDVASLIGPFDGPLLYLDTDVVVSRPIIDILRKISVHEKSIFICDETRHFADHIAAPVSGLSTPLPRFARWFGYDMMLADEQTKQSVMPMANSGIFAYRDRLTLERIESIVSIARNGPGAAEIEKEFTDQPVFNYAAAKNGDFSRNELTDVTLFWNVHDEPTQNAHFHHFLWAKGSDKPNSMARLMQRLPVAS